MKNIINKYLLVILLITIIQGCYTNVLWFTTEKSQWEIAKSTNTIEAYEVFINRYPDSEFVTEAKKNILILKDQIYALEQATLKVLQEGAEVEVDLVSRYPDKPEFVISAHLLEGHSADERSPYVLGDYDTHEKLTRLVRLRCAKILKSIAETGIIPDGSSIIIKARHGVRQTYYPQVNIGTDVGMTIYEINMPIDMFKNHDLYTMNEEEIMLLWRVKENIIPQLQFQYEWR